MTYGKLNGGEIEYAPRIVTVGDTNYIPPTTEWLTENGYKPVRFTDEPTEEGYYFVPYWTETDDEIVQAWERHENEASEQDLLDALTELGVKTDDENGTE